MRKRWLPFAVCSVVLGGMCLASCSGGSAGVGPAPAGAPTGPNAAVEACKQSCVNVGRCIESTRTSDASSSSGDGGVQLATTESCQRDCDSTTSVPTECRGDATLAKAYYECAQATDCPAMFFGDRPCGDSALKGARAQCRTPDGAAE